MAENPAKKYVAYDDNAVELSDSDDALSMKEFRNMITRKDWLQVYKEQCEGEKFTGLQKESEVVLSSVSPALPIRRSLRRKRCQIQEKPVADSISDIECISIPDSDSISGLVTECVSLPVAQTRQRRKSPRKVTKTISVSPQKRRRKAKDQGTKKTTVTISVSPQKRRRKAKDQDTMHQATQGRRKGNRRRVQPRRCEAADPEIVFLSDNESEITTVQRTEAHSRINVTGATSLNDSVEVLSVSSHQDCDDELIDDQDREINILFCWRNKILKLPMKQSTQFGTVLSTLSSNWEVQGSDIMLLYNDEIVKAGDTPSTYDMLSGSIIDCSIVKSRTTAVDTTDPNAITIKFQTKNSRDKKLMAVHQMAQFQSIIEQFAKEESVSADKIVFTFDGDVISPTDTPFGLGIENNFSIDVTY